MERPQHPDFHPHYFTRDTPHVRIEDGNQRPYRPAGSWFEIDNQIGWSERQLGQGGGLGSDRHTDRLMDGIGWAGACAIVIVPSLFYPPLLVILLPMILLSMFTSVINWLERYELRGQARDAAEAARQEQMPHQRPTIKRASFGEGSRVQYVPSVPDPEGVHYNGPRYIYPEASQ